jgi:hypothetical protein
MQMGDLGSSLSDVVIHFGYGAVFFLVFLESAGVLSELLELPIWDNSESLRCSCSASFCPRLGCCCCFCGFFFSERFDFADMLDLRLISPFCCRCPFDCRL